MTQTFTLYRVKCSYQVRFCLLQAAHYGTPQTRVRFYLFGAQRGYPLFAAPKPTLDFSSDARAGDPFTERRYRAACAR